MRRTTIDRDTRWTTSRMPMVAMAAVCALSLVAAACGNGDSESSDSGDRGDAVSDVSDVESATIQIVARGSFAQPSDVAAFEEVQNAGTGSGFIIDPSGIAVTNNHVVTGNASLEVYVGGSDDPVNARVLGTSECSDLAVIEIDGGPYPYLDWYDGEVDAGLEVRAAGFPLGDPEFTLTTGIVSKADADGDSDWASVDSVIEHDAAIQPGNSGGPLVDAETATVVAVNYAGGDPGTGTSQYFAIPAGLAQPLADELREGDVESLGVNGVAVADEESGLSGIWVSSVDTNSPAGELGLQAGDIIEQIEGLALATDGTMKDYCDVLGSRQPTDKLATRVLRFADDVGLVGEFNGDNLNPVASLGTVIEEETGESLEGGTEYADYTEISDDTGTITVEVPTSWSEVDGTEINRDDGTVLQNVSAAPDLQAFFDSWTSPGLSLSAAGPDAGSDVGEFMAGIEGNASESCTPTPAQDYDDGLYTGLIQVFTDCGGTGAITLGIVAQPEDAAFTALVVIQLLTEADVAVADRVIESFVINP